MALERKVMFACLTLIVSFSFTLAREATVFDVTKYGARTDSNCISEALSKAWKEACSSGEPSRVLIPKGKFNLRKAILEGPCKSQIRLQLEGTLVAPSNPSVTKNGDGWITFEHVNKLTVAGGGTFDGQGQTVWGKHCDKDQFCGKLPINIRLDFCTNSVIREIVSLNSKQFHINVLGGQNITFYRVSVIAPDDSPNTDGIHIGRSDGINIIESTIKTGDDCISIGDGTKNINITKVTCGPGHGISVGSLGKYPKEEPVEGVTVTNCTIKGTSNGVRIKTWPDSVNGLASKMHFDDIVMDNVSNPILIDQEYCPWNKCNKKTPSKVKISDVRFRNIRGTSGTPLAVNLICSSGFPCENVEIADIDLKYNGEEGEISSLCKNVKPKTSGKQNPPACLTSSSKVSVDAVDDD